MEKADIRPIKFWTKYVEGKDGLREVHWCEYARVGDAKYQTTPEAISRLRTAPGLWAAIEPHYEAWLKGHKVVENGTPLDAWVGLSAEQIEVLKVNDCHTLEDLVALTDSQRDRVGLPGLVNLQAGAKRFLTGLTGGKVDAALAEKDAQIAALQSQMADLMALIGRDNDEEPVKRRPGRPRREEMGEEAA